ncbi:MAG: lipoprotein signal peptidase [Bacteroidaceae bacterium]|jgi:signal peptidase II|nr:lipoprotein signal peptidase [Bacteroidaceae bacterium]
MSLKTKYALSTILFIAVLVADQIIKVCVKTGMYLGERIEITSWFQLVFVENNGMAFGWELYGGKLFLTLFRILAVCFIGWFIHKEIRRGRPMGYIVCLTLVMAGAAGNIIDCLFYGLIFNNPPYPLVAEFVPWDMGYGELLYGRVVDMFYFPLVEWDMPEWVPVYGGEHCVFFSPVFNFADAAISCGIVALILFYHKILNEYSAKTETTTTEETENTTAS